MLNNQYDEDAGPGTIFRDVFLSLFICIFVLLVLVVPFINDPGKKKDNIDVAKPIGTMMIEMDWPQKATPDIDLWAKSPKDTRAVGFSNKGGIDLNLLRDDLGTYRDLTDRNYEVIVSRGIVPFKEYIINVHWYGNELNWSKPIEVKVRVTVHKSPTDNTTATSRIILFTSVILRKQSEELTVFRFKLDEHYELIKSSVHATPMSIMSADDKKGFGGDGF